MFYVFTLITAIRHIKLLKFKQNFTDNIPHEFKTPISTIALASEGLRDKDLMSNTNLFDSYLNIISTENKRLEQMVDAILENKNSFSELKLEIVDINKLIEEAIHIVKLLIDKKQGEVVFVKTDKPNIRIDKQKILIVIKNILENAIKYNDNKPHIIIKIMIKRNKMILSFQDNGIGIEKKELPKIFEQFYRVSTGYVHNVKGYGLGLNYIKTILKLHRGKIKVESVLYEGTTFRIYLPINQNVWKRKRKF
jgi:two-component system phosphate regulon sensor histidine kinase PhoR